MRGRGQQLEPALKLGREGLTPAVITELERLLRAHELVKVRFLNTDRDEKAAACDQVAAALRCECVGAVGHTALFYRANPEPAERRIEFPG